MHKDLVKDGLVVISLSIDEADEKENALSFLKKQNATFQNFLLVETDANKEKWEKKFPHTSPPIMNIYDRDGKLHKTLEGKKEVSKADEIVKELLKK